MKDMKGKVAVVTGAASGIGLGLAERFAVEGMKVVLADVEAGPLAAAERQVKATGAPTLAVRTDVGRAKDVEALAQKTLEAFGAVHVVCNNAGITGDAAPIWEQTPQAWKWILGVNLWGVLHGIRTFVPIMLRQGTEGHVVNTASMAGHLSAPLVSPYHATKFAVVTLTESLHMELALTGAAVKASVLCPGFVRTNIMDSNRNRPAEVGSPPPASEASQAMRAAYERFVAAGLPPAKVADCVLDAIRAERFWVFPHPELLPAVQMRMQDILAQENPMLPNEMRAAFRI
jgi:NAD(P)-dependent dehydrogenase (short-subunit alcohol dehydrogenase family)